jgi:hypothetical protein
VETSVKILIVAGMFSVSYGMLLGIPLAQARMKSPTAPRQLVNAHLEALIQGAVLLGLAVAAGFSTLPRGLEITAAFLLAIGGGLASAGGTANWLQAVDDAFAAKSPGWALQSLSGPLTVAGALLLLVGVLKAL